MRRLIALIGKNKVGPWVCIAMFGKPKVQITGSEGEVTLFHCEKIDGQAYGNVRLGNGQHSIPSAKYCRIEREHSSDILCLITSG